jgi:hypothetical protein
MLCHVRAHGDIQAATTIAILDRIIGNFDRYQLR